MGIQDEIRLKNLERINSIYYQFIDRTELSKSEGCISEYETCKGEEIKKALQPELNKRVGFLKEYEQVIIKAVNSIGVKPSYPCDEMIPEQWKGKVQIPFNVYSYSQIYSDGINKSMNYYNKKVNQYIEAKIINTKLDEVFNNIGDETDYNLPKGFIDKLNL